MVKQCVHRIAQEHTTMLRFQTSVAVSIGAVRNSILASAIKVIQTESIGHRNFPLRLCAIFTIAASGKTVLKGRSSCWACCLLYLLAVRAASFLPCDTLHFLILLHTF